MKHNQRNVVVVETTVEMCFSQRVMDIPFRWHSVFEESVLHLTSQWVSCVGSVRSYKCHRKGFRWPDVLENMKSSSALTARLMEGIKTLRWAIIQIDFRDKEHLLSKTKHKKGIKTFIHHCLSSGSVIKFLQGSVYHLMWIIMYIDQMAHILEP